MSELVIVSAADDAALVGELDRLVAYLDRVPDAPLRDVAYTCALSRGASVLAVIAADASELRARLASARTRLAAGAARLRDKSGSYYFREHLIGEGKGKLAFVYPGVMSFYPDMMRDLVIVFDECRSAFDELEEAMVGVSDFTPSSFVFPPAPYYRHDADIYSSGAYAQALVATYAGCAALTRLLARAGVNPDGVVGFAGGDLAAMMRSGTVGANPHRPDRVRVLGDIYRIVDKAVGHAGLPKVAMVTVILRRPDEIDELVKSFPKEKFTLAVDFSPRQKTYAIAPDFEQEALARLAEAGVKTLKLALDRPFNTPACSDLAAGIRKFATGWMRHSPVCDIYSCAQADRLPSWLRSARKDMGERWAQPVRFVETIRKMYDDGYRVFLEVGPRGLMTRAVEDTLRTVPHAAVAMNSIHRRGLLQLQHALAQLAALGADVDIAPTLAAFGARKLDLDAAIPSEVRRDAEMPLQRRFPRLSLLTDATAFTGKSALASPTGRGARAAVRAAVAAQNARRQRQFDFGALNPLVSDADVLESVAGVKTEVRKTFRLSDAPFIGDFALGTSQMSYSDPNLRGLVLLSLPVGAEIMAEVARLIVPNRALLRIENLDCRRMVAFDKGALTLFAKAERVAAGQSDEAAVKVQLRDDSPNSAYTWPVMEATFVFVEGARRGVPAAVEPLARPRSVHWSGRDVYPQRVCYGRRLRGIQFVEAWSESGLDYQVQVPPLAGNVNYTRFPMWVVNPVLLGAIVSGFVLWRSHERFNGAFSFPIRLRRLEFCGVVPKEGATVNCYLRLAGVTPRSHISDITVTDGNGQTLIKVAGWEELTERVPPTYRDLVQQPAMTFLTESLSKETLGSPATEVSSAFATDVPYALFEKDEELWLKTLSHVILGAEERREFAEMTGSTKRRTEWLFGRVAAKEAVRRFLKDYYQARWSDADVRIWANGAGKPIALGAWSEFISGRLDVAIAHTQQFIVAVAAANARVGVDVESLSRDLTEEFTAGVFTPEELELAAQAATASVAIFRFWCAKEAVSKALGTGIRYSPRELVVTDYQPDAGRLVVRLEGAWLEAFKTFRGRDIPVTVRTVRDHALAFCFLPATLFDEDT